jgi:predicted transcriptional regulator
MLGIRLSAEAEERLERHARALGRGKSVVAREWILERLDREELDRKIRDAAALHAGGREQLRDRGAEEATAAWLRWLDAEDGGYDWGPEGPPAPI